jgi:Cu-Zn family superoxide dismutase
MFVSTMIRRTALPVLALLSLSLTAGCDQVPQDTQTEAREAIDNAAEKTKDAVVQAGLVAKQRAQEARARLAEQNEADASDGAANTAMLDEDRAELAVATLEATAGNEAHGTVHFSPADEGGLRVRTIMRGLPPGKHAYHLHLYGDCSAPDGSAAGTHFNLKGSSKSPPADIDRITGNLGDLIADQNGNGEHSAVIPDAQLTGAKAIIGRSVIVHAKPNDPAQPPIGGAGGRLACGVVGIADPQMMR